MQRPIDRRKVNIQWREPAKAASVLARQGSSEGPAGGDDPSKSLGDPQLLGSSQQLLATLVANLVPGGLPWHAKATKGAYERSPACCIRSRAASLENTPASWVFTGRISAGRWCSSTSVGSCSPRTTKAICGLLTKANPEFIPTESRYSAKLYATLDKRESIVGSMVTWASKTKENSKTWIS
jgi:hypothetical protein